MGPKNKDKDGLRNRKPGQKNEGSSGDSPNVKTSSPSPPSSAAGMTCLNWLMVLFFICLVGGGTAFFIHQEMTLTNRALMKELQMIKQESTNMGDFKQKIKEVVDVLDVVKSMQNEFEDVKAKQSQVLQEVSAIRSKAEDTEKGFTELRKQVADSLFTVESFQKDVAAVKKKQESVEESQGTKETLSLLNDHMAVSKTNMAYISDEVKRLDKRVQQQFEQIGSMQKEIINLTAEKTEYAAVTESMKSTIVSVRERVQKLEEGEGLNLNVVKEMVEGLEKKSNDDITRLSREISEQRENSAQWLQESMKDLTARFHISVEDLNQKLSEVKTQSKEPEQATDTEAIVNSIADLDIKFRKLSDKLREVGEGIQFLEGKITEESTSSKEIDEVFRKDIGTVSTHVRSILSNNEQVKVKLDDITKEVSKLSGDVDRVTSVTGTLGTKLDEVKVENQKLESAIQSMQGKQEPK